MVRTGSAMVLRRQNFRAAGVSVGWSIRALSQALPSWSTVDPTNIGAAAPGKGANLVGGKWTDTKATTAVIDPMNGQDMVLVPNTSHEEARAFVESMKQCPETGLHSPLRNVERYQMLGHVCFRLAEELHKPEVADYFAALIQRVVPKSQPQCMGEIITCRKWLMYFSGDSVRNLARSFALPGDRLGQETRGYRFPFGHTAVITPFNFPLEIPLIQSLSSLFMGNKCLVKVDDKVAIVYEQFLRLAHHCGLPLTDIDLMYSDGPVANKVLVDAETRMTLFTGSQAIAEKLTIDLRGKVKLEDAGFDWKILGPDVPTKQNEFDYVVWQADQDAYAFSGQKCSAQSIMMMHQNWVDQGVTQKLADQAARRRLSPDLTISPVLTWPNDKITAHIEACLKIPGARVEFGGKPVDEAHTIPACYGSFQPTALFVPIEELLKPGNFELCTTELFGPFQILTHYTDDQIDMVLEMTARFENKLTAGIVSNDPHFVNHILGNTINGTTYAGLCAKTTAAPQQHWFGPSGDPRSAGIHTPEAIQLCWSGHREIIHDVGPVPSDFTAPCPT